MTNTANHQGRAPEPPEAPELSIAIGGALGLTWPLWKRLVDEVEGLGFAALYYVDQLPNVLQVYNDSLEGSVALSYLADHTQRVRFGLLPALMGARDPVTLARQAIALDDLSGGRFVLGLGAGGQKREYEMFGYSFGDTPARAARMEEGVE